MKHILHIVTISSLLLTFGVPAKASFTLKHRMGIVELPAGEGQDALFLKSGQQVVHVDSIIMYAAANEVVNLPRPDKKAYTTYVRWYNYDTDNAITLNDRYTGSDQPELQCNINNARGKFQIGNLPNSNSSCEAKYTTYPGDQVIRIAADLSAYKNYTWTVDGEDTTFIEPTISKRRIYVFRPASEMAQKIYDCTNNTTYLEEHKMMAPVGRQLYLGPDYAIIDKNLTHGNYYYFENNNPAGAAKRMSDATKWSWKIGNDGEKVFLNNSGTANENTIINGQYKSASSNTPGDVTYYLQYTVSGRTYNIAKFIVTYYNASEIGPSASVSSPEATSKMELLYEQNFNYNRPGTTAQTYYKEKHLPVEESSYGCYYPDIAFIGGSKGNRPNGRPDLTSGEYGICNKQDVWVAEGAAPMLYNHVEGHENTEDDAKEGYFLYVDGSDLQGEVFSLEVNADLCPGSTMYFYSWLIDGSSSGKAAQCAPNMDFVVIGEDANGTEHILTTYTTGEFGINAVENTSNPSVMMERCTWYQVMFPVYIDQNHIYPRYELKILNKGKGNDGNDFAIDDIRVYAQKPPVMPLQASTSECVDQAVATITAYLRIDYQEIDYEGKSLFFQWRDENNAILPAEYYNMDSPGNKSTEYGCVPVKQESELTDADKCASLLDFDSQFRNTETTVIRYIEEKINLTTTRYVMYIAMPIEVRPNHTYTGFVSPLVDHLGLREEQSCGTFADLYVSGGTRITINDEITTDEVVHVCGHRDYTLNIVLTQVVQDYTTENLKVDTFHCKADWLVGDPEYVNAHPDIYLNTFDEIQADLDFYHQNPNLPEAKAAVDYLLREGLLFLDTFGISMTPELALSYTAFPRGKVQMPDGLKEVCSAPRFLHIQPAKEASNMMVVGKDASEYDDLPDVVKNRPRIIRISDAQKREGWFDVPLYRIGDENESYIIDRVYVISSTDPNWRSIALISDHDEMRVKDTIHLGDKKDHNDPINVAIQSLKPGYDYTFHVAFAGESDEDRCDRGHTYFTLRVVPDAVTWMGGDWNRDASWDYFVPMDTTNVILQAQDYNVTFASEPDPAESFDFNYKRNTCRNIYIPANASMKGQENIEIRGTAFVDIPVMAQKWALTSIPIKGIVSGDLFVSQNEDDNPFTVANIVHGKTSEQAIDRATYEVYDSPYDTDHNNWIRPDSLLDRPIRPTDAVMIAIDYSDPAAEPVIRLPKPNNYYRYYDFNTNNWRTEDKEITEGLRADLGKPAWDGNTSIKLTRAYDNMYMFGNPTFGYIDLTQLMADNTGKLTGRYFMTPAEGTSDQTIDLATIDPNADHVLLPPCRGVLLEGNGANELTITINVVTPSATSPATPAPKRRIQSPLTFFDPQGGIPIGAITAQPVQDVHLDEWSKTIDKELYPWLNDYIPTLRIRRELFRDGAYNTLCLPFSMTTEQIAASPLTGAQIFTFTHAEKASNYQLDIEVAETDHIDAGVPYLIQWEPTTPEVIDTPLVFHNVYIETNGGMTVGEDNEVRFVGSVPRKLMVFEDTNNLFVGANNILYWPNTHNPLRGFRAYFLVPEEGEQGVEQGTPARFVVRTNVATENESIQTSEFRVQKIVRDGQVFILRDGKMYSVLGQKVE